MKFFALLVALISVAGIAHGASSDSVPKLNVLSTDKMVQQIVELKLDLNSCLAPQTLDWDGEVCEFPINKLGLPVGGNIVGAINDSPNSLIETRINSSKGSIAIYSQNRQISAQTVMAAIATGSGQTIKLVYQGPAMGQTSTSGSGNSVYSW